MGTLYQVDGTTGQIKGIINNGTSTPGSGTEGELFYRTDLDQLLAHDGSDFKAVNGGSFRVYREKVNETPNGATTIFTVDNSYVSDSTEVFLNGVLQEKDVDYTESTPSTGEITFTTAPLSSAIITVSYSRVEGSTLPLLNKFDVVVGTTKDTYSGSTTVFDLPFAYTTGSGSLLVYSGGVLMLEGASEDYVETDSNTVTFNSARTTGEVIQFVKLGAANDQSTSGWIDGGTSVHLQTSTDNVAIGLTTASEKLHVDGNLRIDNGALLIEQDGNINISFQGDTDTGIFSGAADRIGFKAGNNTIVQITDQLFQVAASRQLNIPDGSSASPSLLLGTSETDTGIFLSSANTIGFTAGGTERASLSSNALTLAVAHELKTTSTSSTPHSAGAESVILVDASGGAFTVDLPTASGITGRVYFIKKTDSSANTVTIDGNSSETIDGSTTYVLDTQYEAVTIVSDGTNWFVL